MMERIFKKEKSIAELEEETERLEAQNKNKGVELSIAQKRQAIAELKEHGLAPKHFQFDWSRIVAFLKTH